MPNFKVNCGKILLPVVLFVFATFANGQVQISTTPAPQNDTISICQGSTITFTDNSQNGIKTEQWGTLFSIVLTKKLVWVTTT